MSRELTRAEKVMLAAIAEETPAALRDAVDRLVPPKNMVSAGAAITSTAPAPDTAVRIPDSYLGKEYPGQEGLFLGYFDHGKGVGEKPVFVVELTEPMTFNQTVTVSGKSANGYQADAYTYDAMQGLREGKTAIATIDMLWAAYKNRSQGAFKEMFKNVGRMLSSSPPPDYPGIVRVVGFRHGGDVWYYKDGIRAPSMLVRTALTL